MYAIFNIFKTKGFNLLLFLFSSTFVYAQVGGLSGSKLGAVCVDVVDHHIIEFEPSFATTISKKVWDSDGRLNDLYKTKDSVMRTSDLSFRFTYGLWDKMEIGTKISTDLQLSSWGARFILFDKKKYGVALIAGATIPFGNKRVDNSRRLADNLISLGGGAVFSAQLTENLSFDMDAQYMAFVRETHNNHKGSYYINADLGYYLYQGQLQLVGSISYQNSTFDYLSDNKLTVNPGITIETGKSYIIVLSAPFDVAGRNTIKNAGFNFALTLSFD